MLMLPPLPAVPHGQDRLSRRGVQNCRPHGSICIELLLLLLLPFQQSLTEDVIDHVKPLQGPLILAAFR